MALLLLIIIYLAFISLGLPDSLLGAAWPVIRGEFGVPLGSAGYLFMTTCIGTIAASLSSGWLLRRFGTGKVTLVSVLLTALSLAGYSLAPSYAWFWLMSVPLGLGAGAVDSGLNAYVATHYKSRHMSWLHCFWGVGAMTGPLIMAGQLGRGISWRYGYSTVALIQAGLAVILFFALPLWSRAAKSDDASGVSPPATTEAVSPTGPSGKPAHPLKIGGMKTAMVAFFLYCGTEATMGLWGGSYLVNTRGFDPAMAAKWVSLFYGGITAGRLATGFLTMKLSNTVLIRSGQSVILVGALLILLPLPQAFALSGFILVGLGCAPIYPCMLHETPARFGKEKAPYLMGYQMAAAYSGSTFLPPLFGWAASVMGIGMLPVVVLCFGSAMLFGSERLNAFLKGKRSGNGEAMS
ncbi:MAG: MFS transporter [Rectinemataceae bacterium]